MGVVAEGAWLVIRALGLGVRTGCWMWARQLSVAATAWPEKTLTLTRSCTLRDALDKAPCGRKTSGCRHGEGVAWLD